MNHHRIAIVAALLAAGLAWNTAHAQSGPSLLLSPFSTPAADPADPPTPFNAELDFSALYIDSAGVEDTDSDVGLTWYEGAGRADLSSVHERGAAVGFGLDYLDFDVDADSGLASELTRQSIGIGAWLGEWAGWEIGLTAGAGYAGDEPYNDADAWYAHANLLARYRIDQQSRWLLSLNYDGSRSIFPDIPLPGVAYQRRVDDTLSYTVGIPFSTLYWRPTRQFWINATYAVPFDGSVWANFAIVEELRLFAGYESHLLAFHTEGQRDTDRTFFEQRRIEGGVRWAPTHHAEFVVAGGLAFDQEISRGFDARDLTDEIELDDEPYIRAGVKVKF